LETLTLRKNVSAFPKAMRKLCIRVLGFVLANPSLKTVAVLVPSLWLAVAMPVRAQIAPYVDEHGKLVYMNEDSIGRRSGSTISSSPSAISTAPSDRLDKIVHEAAERHKVDPELVKAVISTESGWNPYAISRKGAVGLMQLIPGTAQRYGVGNPFDPAQNVEGGTTYLKTLLDRYNGDLSKSLAAYNAGEGAVDRSGGVPPFWETRRYVQKVTNAYFRPGSGRDQTQWTPPRNPLRQEVNSKGRVVFTNE
jgi:soluble lytic murein transglycosylase-like protein